MTGTRQIGSKAGGIQDASLHPCLYHTDGLHSHPVYNMELRSRAKVAGRCPRTRSFLTLSVLKCRERLSGGGGVSWLSPVQLRELSRSTQPVYQREGFMYEGRCRPGGWDPPWKKSGEAWAGGGVWPCPGATEEAMTGSGPAGNWNIES